MQKWDVLQMKQWNWTLNDRNAADPEQTREKNL